MRKSYIFVFGPAVGEVDKVREYLDGLPQILNWRCEMPNCFFLVSTESAESLADLILKFSQQKGRFIIAEVDGNKQGWLTAKAWRVINEKIDPEAQT